MHRVLGTAIFFKIQNLSPAKDQLLNEHLSLKFADFVNAYRVKAVQKMLIDPAYNHFTILSMAFDAGFKNKASFNSAFKKHCGQTPTQYKKEYMASQS